MGSVPSGGLRLSCFKSYDVRGRVGVDLDEAVAFGIGRAFVRVMQVDKVVVGHDCRLSSPGLAAALAGGIAAEGASVLDVGQAGTEEVYFATSHLGAGGGMAVTASHNPIEYNGIKFVGPGSRPLTAEEFAAVRDMSAQLQGPPVSHPGQAVDVRANYAEHIAGFVDVTRLRPMNIVVNAGNGVAGPAFDAIMDVLLARGARLTITRVNHQPDGHFPQGVPNPMLRDNRAQTGDVVRRAQADFGVAWDADFDRCFLFDETGAFVDGEYVVGLLAQGFATTHPGANIVHDPRVVWNTQDCIARAGGVAVQSLTGHSWMKAAMRAHDAAYGGEMSAHHYFRDFMFCDSGMIPWLVVAERLSRSNQPLSALVGAMRQAFPSSGERNYRIGDARAIMAAIRARFEPEALRVEEQDGLSLTFANWRMNLRQSNTEPLLRLNVETRGDPALLSRKVAEVEAMIVAG